MDTDIHISTPSRLVPLLRLSLYTNETKGVSTLTTPEEGRHVFVLSSQTVDGNGKRYNPETLRTNLLAVGNVLNLVGEEFFKNFLHLECRLASALYYLENEVTFMERFKEDVSRKRILRSTKEEHSVTSFEILNF